MANRAKKSYDEPSRKVLRGRSKFAATFAICLLLTISSLLVLSVPVSTVALKASAISNSKGTGLAIESAVPSLPADGGSYPSIILQFTNLTTGAPIIPQSSTTIKLSSSSPQIGSVPQSIFFPAGKTFVTANFQTSATPGNTTITAFASGFEPANLTLSTRKVGGIPSQLKVIASPNEIPPDSRLSASVTVEAVDVFGNPVNLGSNLTVALSSSSSQAGSIPNTLVIPAGQSFAETKFTPSFIAGQTVITASASGLGSGSDVITTVGPVPRRLVVSVAPSLIMSNPNETAVVSVQLQDNNSETPAPAPSPVSVVLTSSNTNVAVLPNPPIITISPGQSYASIQVKAGGREGVANITASAQGYVKGSTLLSANATGGTPNNLGITFTPNTLLPNNQTYSGAVTVELLKIVNGIVLPAVSSSPVTVYARSSNNASMQVSTLPAVIPAGRTHVSINVASTFLPGRASITAQSVGLSSATADLLSFGLRPNALNLQFAPATLVSNGGTYGSVFVSLFDLGTGGPARAPVDTIVTLQSNSSQPGTIQNTVTIPAGQTFAIANFVTSGLPGAEYITATASNYTSANDTVTLMTPAATKLGLFAAPSTILADNSSYTNLYVQLEDLQGNPQKTDSPVIIQLETPSSVYGSIQSNVTVQPGMTFAPITTQSTNVTGTISVTAFANGFEVGRATVQSILLPVTGKLTASPTILSAGEQASLSLQATSGGLPLSNATIKWIYVGGGGILSTDKNTSIDGRANALYSAGYASGYFVIEARIIKDGYTPTVVVTHLNLTGIIAKPNNSFFAWTILFIPVWTIILVVGIVAAVFAIRFVRTRRGGGGGGETDADVQ